MFKNIVKVLFFLSFVFILFPSETLADKYTGEIYINSTNGGDCNLVGSWNSTTKTCLLSKDIDGRIYMYSSGVTLDGGNHIVTKTPAVSGNIGLSVRGVSGVVIKNINVSLFNYGILLEGSVGVTVENSTISNAGSAAIFDLGPYGGHTFVDNTLRESFSGLYLDRSSNNKIERNTFIKNRTQGLRLYSSSNNAVRENISKDNGIGISVQFGRNNIVMDNTVENNSSTGLYTEGSDPNYIVHNNFINNSNGLASFNRFQMSDSLPIGGNYWSDYDEAAEGCADTNRDSICDSPKYFYPNNPDLLIYADFFPWNKKDGWKLKNTIPDEFFSEVTSSFDGVENIYLEPSDNSKIIKTVPNNWVVKVLYLDSVNVLDWIKIQDPTDESFGWVKGGLDRFEYAPDKQQEFTEKSSTQITSKSDRGNIIKEAVHNYFTNLSAEKSLYSGKDTANIPILNQVGFPEELALAMISQESGGIYNFNNEIVSFDYGHGIMQITFHAWTNEPDKFLKNGWDNRGKFSKYSNPICRNIVIENGRLKSGTDEYKKCYKNTNTKNTLNKNYDSYNHDSLNPIYKQYTNTYQSIYSNIKDGLAHLQEDKFRSKCPKEDVIISGLVFTCRDIEKILAVWGYNGVTLDPNFNYLKSVSTKLSNLQNDFPGVSYLNGDKLIEKLNIANDNRLSVKVYSPVELSVLQNGDKTGVVNGEILENVPNSSYLKDEEMVNILFPSGNEEYKVKGEKNGSYGIHVESVFNGTPVVFDGIDLPISENEIHVYKMDYNKMLNEDKGILVKIDSNGDGIFERELNVGKELDDITAPEIEISSVKKQYYIKEKEIFNFSAKDNKDENVFINAKLNGVDVLSGAEIVLDKPGKNTLELIAIDDTGNKTIKNIEFDVVYVFGGFLPPIEDGAYYKLNMTLPVKFILYDYFHEKIMNSPVSLYVQNKSNQEFYVEDVKSDPQQGQYIGTIQTKDMSVGEWNINLRTNDGKIHSVLINLK